MTEAIAALSPPENAKGETRGVGVEIEFSGLDVAAASRAVADALDGEIEQVHHQRAHVHAAQGRFVVELDTRWADPDYVAEHAADLDPEIRRTLARGVSSVAGAVLSSVFPVEVVCPPIPHDRLGDLAPVIDRLARAGALGTRHSAFSGFGTHFNVEAARLTVDHILPIMQAYCLMDFSLRRDARIALIRRMQSYILPFPEAYKRHILAQDYRPHLSRFMDDHMTLNPSRDMELDLLPLFAHIDAARVRDALPDEKNSARPTFHWRLPDCRIDEPGWSLAEDWGRWAQVEALAADGDRLASLAASYLREGPTSDFAARVRRFIDMFE
ncbi:amidoligase family protein [Rubrimonas cliftonensis]|uniref:Putative amidoligase enzyme n=1 Tax=Rubrimonas cliftonensis TaxID=89524 RepID=A0A1H4DFC4_9RHOB|nr:amidoligase family protein [Rubrimonas cliftonensis]SEA71455.1 Putative amidoligase enzyme [Rubrimonas cliftonensis]